MNQIHSAPTRTYAAGASNQQTDPAIWTLSPLLERHNHTERKRPRLRRFLIVISLVLMIALLGYGTRVRLWPEIFPFNLAYLAHDGMYLPLKAWLWTVWYPWSLLLFVPLVAGVFFLGWSWVTGQEPTRAMHSKAVLMLLGFAQLGLSVSGLRRQRLLALMVRGSKALGLRTDYLEMVVDHALEQCLDKLEARALKGEGIKAALLRRAEGLMDAQVMLDRVLKRQQPERLLKHLLALGFLSHLPEQGDGRAQARLLQLLADHPEQAAARFGLLNAFVAGQPLSASREVLGALFEDLALCANSAEKPDRRASFQTGETVDPVAILLSCIFAFFRAEDQNWAIASLSTLRLIDRLETALHFAPDRRSDGLQLAGWMRDARLTTIRHLQSIGQQTYGSALEDLILWPEGAGAYWDNEGNLLAAGGV